MKVLHVDDEPDIREIAQMALELDPAFEVESAESAAVALEKIERMHPSVILLDVMMPGMDGPEMFRILRARPETAGIPVVFMTAAAQKHMIEDLRSLGAAGVISKPFDPMSLADDLKEVMSAQA